MIPSLFSRTGSSGGAGSPAKEEVVKTETPKRSVRSLFGSYVSKSAVSPTRDLPLPLQDPFSGLETEEKLAGSEDQLTDAADLSPGSEVEEGLDAAEMSVVSSDLLVVEEKESTQAEAEPSVATQPEPAASKFQPPPLVRDLLNPVLVAALAVANMLLPLWLSGFITGLVLAALLTYWVCSYLNPPASSL